jgi:ComF family protein
MPATPLQKFVDFILPPRCPLTGDVVDSPGMMSAAAWAQLTFIAPPFCACCGRPFAFESADGRDVLRCAPCLQRQPAYDRARHVLVYDDASSDIVLKFKYADQTWCAAMLAQWMARTAAEMLEEVDYVVPVPLHRWRLLKRRYNQAALLAQALARRTGKICLPDSLIRIRATEAQGHRNHRDRRSNVRKAFALDAARAPDMKGRAVLLVDDVFTSGATVEECARVLKKAGARKVFVVTLARAARPS